MTSVISVQILIMKKCSGNNLESFMNLNFGTRTYKANFAYCIFYLIHTHECLNILKWTCLVEILHQKYLFSTRICLKVMDNKCDTDICTTILPSLVGNIKFLEHITFQSHYHSWSTCFQIWILYNYWLFMRLIELWRNYQSQGIYIHRSCKC